VIAVGPIAATPPINPEEGTPRTISRELNIYPRNKAHFGPSRAATELALAEAREIAGWAVTRSGVSFSLHAAPARKFLSGKARQRATRPLPPPSLPHFFLGRSFSRFPAAPASKAVAAGERNISCFPPLFASISTSSTKIEMQGN